MLSEFLQTLPENVQIFSVGDAGRQGEKALNVWFAAHGSPYYKAEKLHGYVAANKAKVRRVLLDRLKEIRYKRIYLETCFKILDC